MTKFHRFFLGLILIVFLLEIFLRLGYSRKLIIWSHPHYQPDTAIGYRYVPNSRGTFTSPTMSSDYSINRLGYPGKNFSLHKVKGTYRIMVVGHSDDVGIGTDSSQTYINILNDTFKRNKLDVEVLNFSIDGSFKILRNIKIIRNECIKYQPDLILLRNEFPLRHYSRLRETYKGIAINYDPKTNIDSAKKFIDRKIIQKNFQNLLLEYSYIYRSIITYYIDRYRSLELIQKLLHPDINILRGYMRKAIDCQDYRKYEPPKTLNVEESLKVLKDLTSYLSSRNIKLILFDTYKHPFEDKYKTGFFHNHINYLPLSIEHEERYSFGELDGHSSPEGHKAIASAFYKALSDSIINK